MIVLQLGRPTIIPTQERTPGIQVGQDLRVLHKYLNIMHGKVTWGIT